MAELFRGALLLLATTNLIFSSVALKRFHASESRHQDFSIALGVWFTELAVVVGQVLNVQHLLGPDREPATITLATAFMFVGMAVLAHGHWKYRYNKPV